VRLMFQPEIIAKSRKNTSTFSTAGRAMTQIGGLPMGAGKSVVHGVTSSITGVFKRDKDHSKGNSQGSENDLPPVPNLPSGQSSQPVGQSPHLGGGPGAATASAFPSTNNGSGSKDPGTLRVTVLSGKDLSAGDIKPYVTLRLGDKEVKTKSAGKTGAPEW
jgi:Ca2+-dependent lipid-binding protein